VASNWKNRIVGEAEETPESLLANPFNHRIHEAYQQAQLEDILSRVGWVTRVIVNVQTQHVIDGHLRIQLAMKHGEEYVPVTYVDLTPDEERLMLATLDAVGDLAKRDDDVLRQLLDDITEGPYELLEQLRHEVRPEAEKPEEREIPEMKLKPFEHYDYVVLLFRDTQDWLAACERLGLGKQSVFEGGKRKIGMGRLVDGAEAMKLWK